MEYRVPVSVEPLEEGGYYAECPILPGCHVEGATYLETLENLQDTIRLHIQGRLKFGDPLPSELASQPTRKKLPMHHELYCYRCITSCTRDAAWLGVELPLRGRTEYNSVRNAPTRLMHHELYS